MERNQARDFTAMIRKLAILFLVAGMSCDPVPPFNDIPIIPFDDIHINTNLPQYTSLRVDGGVHAVDGGIRGIYVYRESAGIFHAFERNCSYLANEACATVDLDPSNLYMIDPCCNSTFTFPNGLPNGGPAFYPLRKYVIITDGDVITITDDIAN